MIKYVAHAVVGKPSLSEDPVFFIWSPPLCLLSKFFNFIRLFVPFVVNSQQVLKYSFTSLGNTVTTNTNVVTFKIKTRDYLCFARYELEPF